MSGWQNFFVDLRRKVATEHPVELAFVAAIIRAMGTGEFRERALQSGALDPVFLETTLFEDLLSAPPLKGGYTDLNIMKRIMWTLGTEGNPEPFVIIESSFNGRKMSVSVLLFLSTCDRIRSERIKCGRVNGYALTIHRIIGLEQ